MPKAPPENQTVPPKESGTYRILHTADWHLGKLLNDRSRDEEHARFLDWLLEVVRTQEVDAILLAGDVFDTANPPQSALRRYYDFVSQLFRQGDCRLVVIAGNHDSAAQLEAPRAALSALRAHVVGSLAQNPAERLFVVPDENEPRVVLALLPFLRDNDLRTGRAGESEEDIRAQVTGGIAERYREAAVAIPKKWQSLPAVAAGHLTVVGAKTSDSEREIHIGGLGRVSSTVFPDAFSYIALGHLHRPQATDEEGRVRYSGSPIPLSFSEWKDEKEVRILDCSPEGIETRALKIPVFRRLLQVRTTTAELEATLKALDPKPGEFQSWVEVVVEDATFEDDLVERVREITEGKDFEVLKVLRGRADALSGMSAEDAGQEEAIGMLLDHPEQVFEHLLDQQEQFQGEEKEELKRAFARLRELQAQPELIEST